MIDALKTDSTSSLIDDGFAFELAFLDAPRHNKRVRSGPSKPGGFARSVVVFPIGVDDVSARAVANPDGETDARFQL